MSLQNSKDILKRLLEVLLSTVFCLSNAVFIGCKAEGLGQAVGSQQGNSSCELIPKLILKPGQAIVTGMQSEDVVVTEDVDLARQQVAAYPDSPEASFILAVALTRTSLVEEALKEVRRARKLADKQGGPAYFDHMIVAYEDMLKSYPNDNRVRYGLAWAYYMKAYVLARYSNKVDNSGNLVKRLATVEASPKSESSAPATVAAIPPLPTGPTTAWHNSWVPSLIAGSTSSHPQEKSEQNPNEQTAGSLPNVGHIPGALEHVTPEAVPQIRMYYESALKNLDELLVNKPDDVWARVYRAFLHAEYTGDLPGAMAVWKQCQSQVPNNPAPYFFLGEAYLRQGNLRECLQNVSKAIALRTLGN